MATLRLVALAGALSALGCNTLLGIGGDYAVESSGAGSPGSSSGGGAASTSQGPGGASAGGAAASSQATGGGPTVGSGAGAGGSPGTGGATGAGGAASCPDGLGPAMVAVDSYCIDATEVTNAEYAAWLATGPDVGGQPAVCAFNATFVPQASWPGPANEPVVYVDWCDARAFCAAAGKRLCGQIGGGSVSFAAYANPDQSEWQRACSSGGTTDYPYGDAYATTACNGADFTQPDKLLAVQQMGACRGATAPYDAIYDMSGNVAEWEDACAASGGATDPCRRRGGSYKEGPTGLRCDADASLGRGVADSRTGFRCCAY